MDKWKALNKEIEIQIGHHLKEDNEPAVNSLKHIQDEIKRIFGVKL